VALIEEESEHEVVRIKEIRSGTAIIVFLRGSSANRLLSDLPSNYPLDERLGDTIQSNGT
jgi:hypothetical protein